MSISFFETMQGDLVDGDGHPHPFRFQVKAEATDTARFLTGGRAKITGVAHGPPFADQALLEGEMVVRPVLGRQITYDFRFHDPQGRPCRLRGEKHPRLTRPVASMTQMQARLTRDDLPVAQGDLHFDLDDLPDFLRSWSTHSTIPRLPLHQDRDGVLTRRERAILGALTEATITAGRHVPAPDDATTDAAADQICALPPHAFWLHRLGLRLLDRASLLTDARPFRSLPLQRRQQLLLRFNDPTRGPLSSLHLLVYLLTTFVKMAHFGRTDYLDAIGHPRPKTLAPEPKERHMRRVITPEDLDEVTEIEAHVAVVGTGAGGAAVAYQLARRGLAVAMIEEGRYHLRHHFNGPPVDRVNATYRHRSTNISLGTPIVIPQGRTVGGTTTINSGTCFATPDEVLLQWRRELGFPDDFAPHAYHRYSRQVEAMLQVEPARAEVLGTIADVIGRGADALDLGHGPLPRNAPGCTGAGECILGCPDGAKRSTDVSYVPAALRAGAECYVGLPATRILMDGDRAVALEMRGTDRFGRPRLLRVRARRIVLACGAIHTPLLLQANGFSNPWIGRNLSVHPAHGMIARMDEDLTPWSAIPQGYAVHALEQQGVRFEGYYLHPQLAAPTLPFVGPELTRWMDDFPQLAQFGFMVRDQGRGTVRRGPGGTPIIRYELSPRAIHRIKLASSLLARIFLEAGAKEILLGFGDDPLIRTDAQAMAVPNLDVGPADFRLLGAHPLGTCRLASSPDRGALDFDHRLFGTDNLHVVDGSSVPTSLGVNPQLTIMAMALRAADRIADALGF